MTHEHEPLTTADLARTEEMRGRSEERIVDRADRTGRDVPEEKLAPADNAPAVPVTAIQQGGAPQDHRTALFAANEGAGLRKRWVDIQTAFVDEPRKAVEHADSLVADVMKRLAETFANERAALERQWDRGDNVTTEDLRIALQRYRTFFDRLLSI